MDEQCATLRQQSKDELIDSIFEMQARVDQLEKRLAELEAKSKRKTPKNSSTPPSRSPKSNQPKKPSARRDPKPGHSGCSRANAEPDVIVDCRVEVCPTCGYDLSATTHRQISSSQRVDIPPVQPRVVEARRYRGNIQISLPGHMNSPFAWFEAVAPPIIVLATAYVIKEQILETIEVRHANERAYQAALDDWKAATSNPEGHPSWPQFHANALQDALRKANARRKETLDQLTIENWRVMVSREMHADRVLPLRV